MEFYVKGKKQLKILSHSILVFISIGLLRSSYFNFLRSFQILLFLTNFFQRPSLYRHENVTPVMDFSVNGKKKLENLPYKFFVIVSIALLRSSYCNFLRAFQSFLILTIFTRMPSFYRHEKVTRFKEFSANGEKNNLKNFPMGFQSLFQLHCYGQVTSISYVHFRSLCS